MNSAKFIKEHNLKEHTCYLVEVCYSKGNPIHEAILFIGFNNGGYCEIYENSYDKPHHLSDAFFIKVIKELYTFSQKVKFLE